ncbi:hypothetical protein [Streptomyces sp. CBMA156]|uniref:hypothetical protein n=1 Tax=Streptomyces sp. CBMA156 TaxID=1930280 RepID=UPI001661B2A7|nr:hypothetical protein [Streptomyces sp. CBMA156]MBD0672620.1 hypothetical protein [Streptomyces sp. CBMA156]
MTDTLVGTRLAVTGEPATGHYGDDITITFDVKNTSDQDVGEVTLVFTAQLNGSDNDGDLKFTDGVVTTDGGGGPFAGDLSLSDTVLTCEGFHLDLPKGGNVKLSTTVHLGAECLKYSPDVDLVIKGMLWLTFGHGVVRITVTTR